VCVAGNHEGEHHEAPDDGSPGSSEQPETPQDGTIDGDGNVATEDTDVIPLIRRLLKDMTSPEAAVTFELEQTEHIDDNLQSRMEAVHKGIEASRLHGGPADADALFDFHHVRLAFEPVWQELFDEKLIATGKKLYDEFVAIGVDPNDYLNIAPQLGPVSLGVNLDKALALFITDKNSTMPVEVSPPAIVLAAFEITADEWARLGKIPDSEAGIGALIAQIAVRSEDNKHDPAVDQQLSIAADLLFGFSEAQKALVLLARELVTPISKDFYQQENNAWMSFKVEKRRQFLRQGQRIISYVRDHAFTGEQLDQLHEFTPGAAGPGDARRASGGARHRRPEERDVLLGCGGLVVAGCGVRAYEDAGAIGQVVRERPQRGARFLECENGPALSELCAIC
jgi:hypothetical protein